MVIFQGFDQRREFLQILEKKRIDDQADRARMEGPEGGIAIRKTACGSYAVNGP